MEKLTCCDGTVINYRLPNVIELYQLKNDSKYGDTSMTGYGYIAGILSNCEKFIEEVEGKQNWQECLESRQIADDLSTLALSLMKDGVGEKEKKSSKRSAKT